METTVIQEILRRIESEYKNLHAEDPTAWIEFFADGSWNIQVDGIDLREHQYATGNTTQGLFMLLTDLKTKHISKENS